MFQFAAGKKISTALNCPLVFDTNFLEDRTTGVVYRNYDLDIFSKICHEISNKPNQEKDKLIINDDNISQVNLESLDSNKSVYLDGFFQKFCFVEEQMKKIFYIEKAENEICNELLKEITSCESLMINIRRADYVSRPNALAFHGFLENRYVESAFSKINKKIEKVFIFSDEPEWCKENITINNSKVVDHKFAGKKFKDYLFLMSHFNNMIIPNSTFAWWAAWMAKNKNANAEIVAPGSTLWFAGSPGKSKGLIPPDWKTVEKKDL